jgi:hypothetical protein
MNFLNKKNNKELPLDIYSVEDYASIFNIFYDKEEIGRLRKREPKRYNSLNNELRELYNSTNIQLKTDSDMYISEYFNQNKPLGKISINDTLDINDATAAVTLYKPDELQLKKETYKDYDIKYKELIGDNEYFNNEILQFERYIENPTIENILKLNTQLSKWFEDEEVNGMFIGKLNEEEKDTEEFKDLDNLKSLKYTTDNIAHSFDTISKVFVDSDQIKKMNIREFRELCDKLNKDTDPEVNNFINNQTQAYKIMFKYNLLNLDNLYKNLDEYIDYFDSQINKIDGNKTKVSLKDREKFKKVFDKYDKEINDLFDKKGRQNEKIELLKQKYNKFANKLQSLSVLSLSSLGGNDPVLKFTVDSLVAVLEIFLAFTKQAVLVCSDIVKDRNKDMKEYRKIEEQIRKNIKEKNELVRAYNKEIDKFTSKLSKDDKELLEKDLYLKKQFEKFKDKDLNLKILLELLSKFSLLSKEEPTSGAYKHYDKIIKAIKEKDIVLHTKLFNKNVEITPEKDINSQILLSQDDFETLRKIANSEENKKFLNFINYCKLNPELSARELFQKLKMPISNEDGYRVKSIYKKNTPSMSPTFTPKRDL